jgi:phage tail-like protein
MASAGDVKKPIGTTNFQIGISGLNTKHARSVSGFNINFEEINELTVDEQGKPERTRFPTAGPVWQEISIEQALTDDLALWDWFKQSHIDGDWENQMKEGTLTLYNQKLEEVLTYSLTEAWPTKYGVPGFAASGGGMALETLSLVAKFERTK